MRQAEASAPPPFIDLRRPSISESTLQDVFQELDVDDNGVARNDDTVRPQKRRRLYSETTFSSNIATYDDIVTNLYQLLGSQIATDLDGLHLVAT